MSIQREEWLWAIGMTISVFLVELVIARLTSIPILIQTFLYPFYFASYALVTLLMLWNKRRRYVWDRDLTHRASRLASKLALERRVSVWLGTSIRPTSDADRIILHTFRQELLGIAETDFLLCRELAKFKREGSSDTAISSMAGYFLATLAFVIGKSDKTFTFVWVFGLLAACLLIVFAVVQHASRVPKLSTEDAEFYYDEQAIRVTGDPDAAVRAIRSVEASLPKRSPCQDRLARIERLAARV